MAQGPLFGAAYVFSICNVQEMLQIDSCTINTCDFFHGPFEILDKRTSLFQLISVGRSRCNDERGIRFVNQYGGERVYQLDAKELGLNDIKDSVSEYFNHLIFAPILNNVYMRALSAVTHKDYMTRRYMWEAGLLGDIGSAVLPNGGPADAAHPAFGQSAVQFQRRDQKVSAFSFHGTLAQMTGAR